MKDLSDSVDGKIMRVLLQRLSNAVAIRKATMAEDKAGADFIVRMAVGRAQGVDAKVRREDWRKKNPKWDDVALETWSCIEPPVIGWVEENGKHTDYFLHYWIETERALLFRVPELRQVWRENKEAWKKYRHAKQYSYNRFTKAKWESECVFVPRVMIEQAIWANINDALYGDSNTYGKS